MTGIVLRPRLISVAFSLIPFMGVLICGQDQAGRYDILLGTEKESSCQLKDTIHSTCNASITPPPLNVTPTTSLCTCNKIFFNIWSACSYASGNNTLPVFSLWTSTCTNHSVDLASSASLSTSTGRLGINIPVWAALDVPGNTTFDLQKAVVLVQLAPKQWSTLQIVTPFIAAILSIIITLFTATIYRRKIGKVNWRDEFVHRLRPPQKVKSLRQSILASGWEIEPQEAENHAEGVQTIVDEPFVFVDALSSPVDVGLDTIPGNPSRYSESSGALDSPAVGRPGAGGGTDTIPGNPSQYSVSLGGTRERPAVDRITRGYPFTPTYQIQARTPLLPVRLVPGTVKNRIPAQASDSEMDTSRGWRFPGSSSFKGILRPWKRGPDKLVEVQPTRGFRVDPSISELWVNPSMERSETTRDSATTSYPRTSFDVADHLGESDSPAYRDRVHEGDGDVASDDEDTNLISPEEREERRSGGVLTTTSLAARSSGTTNPNINVVSPTVSPSSPKSTRIPGPSPLKTNVAVPVIPPIIPPPPTQPAPSAPANIFRRVLQRRQDNVTETSITQQPPIFLDPFTMMPIQEDRSEEGTRTIRNSPEPITTRSNSNSKQGTSDPGPSHSVLKRMPSDEVHRRVPSPALSMSGPALPHILRANQRAPSPSPSLRENLANASPNLGSKTSLSRLLPFEPHPPPMYSHHHHRSASASASSLVSVTRNHDDIYGDPVLPKAPIRGGRLSADDTASFILTPDPLSAVPPRNGSPCPQVGRDGVEALFPASVRGAGYRGIPNN